MPLWDYLLPGLTPQAFGVLIAGIVGFGFAVWNAADQAEKSRASDARNASTLSLLTTTQQTIEDMRVQQAKKDAAAEAEKQAAIQAAATKAERDRRDGIIRAVRQEYFATHDGISPQIMAGTDWPPDEWMNEALARAGEVFTFEGRGVEYVTMP